MLRRGSAVSALAGLWLVVSATQPGFGWEGVAIGLLLFVSVTGMLGANAIASLMALFPERAGATAALAVVGQFGLGALVSAGVGVLSDGSPLAMCLVVALYGAGSNIALFVTRRFR